MRGDSTWAGGLSSPGTDPQTREDALDVLQDALAWELAAGCWKVVAQTVDALGAALVASNTAAFREAVCDLERASPYRATPFGEESTVSPPDEQVRERINELIHSLEDPRTVARWTAHDDADTRE